MPLRDFLQNPTKISSSLKQIRNFLRCDGLACYFDPYLEAEALGGELRWSREDLCQLILSSISETADFRQRLYAPEEVAQKGRTPVAIDVVRRLKLMLREEAVLMAGVTGPCTLSSRLLGLQMCEVRERGHLSAPAAEFAAEVAGQMATKFVEAGADVIFIVEEVLPVFSAEAFDDWVSLLVPVINVIQFYEALPV
ncbi:MAG: uroporphyrinogen decarboxylase family protein, partial [bacterium]|nr:uroporphyrinogen decarboxylase family protein [bacterium]